MSDQENQERNELPPGEERLRHLGLSFHKNEYTEDSILLNCDVKEITPLMLALLLNLVNRIDGEIKDKGVEYTFIKIHHKEYYDRVNFNLVNSDGDPSGDSFTLGYAIVVHRTQSTGNNLCVSRWFEEPDFNEAAKSLIDQINL